MTTLQCKLLSVVLYYLLIKIKNTEINAVKVKKTRQRDQRKIKYLVFKNVLNSDYRLKHNSTNHQDFVKSNKNIPYKVFSTLKNAFEFRTKKPKTNDDTNNNGFLTEQANICCKT